jgi:hypothetical protein
MAKLGAKTTKKSNDSNHFTLTLGLKVEPWEVDILRKRFKVCRHVSNCLTKIAERRWEHVSRDKSFLAARQSICLINSEIAKEKGNKTDEIKEQQQAAYEAMNDFLRPLNLDSEWSFHREVANMARKFGLPFDVAQKMATRVYGGFVDLLDGKANGLGYAKHYEAFSIEGKTNRQNITIRRFAHNSKPNTALSKDRQVIKYEYWVNLFGLDLPVIVRTSDDYARKALVNFKNIKYCRLCYCPVDGYYLQVIFKGLPPAKKARVFAKKGTKGGLDIGTQTYGYTGEDKVMLDVLCPEIDKQEAQKRILLRKMDRSRRATNPDNYRADGTVKCGLVKNGKKVRLRWVVSNNYLKTLNEYRSVCKKIRMARKTHHYKLANAMAADAHTIYVEPMNFAGMAKRGKTVDDKGDPITKGRFGKSINHRAPSMFLTILAMVLNRNGGQLVVVDSYNLKASQYNHQTDSFTQKTLSERWNILSDRAGPIRVQRDAYSSFLLRNVNEDLATYDKERILKDFDSFMHKHNAEIKRLEQVAYVLPSSLGINRRNVS